MPEQLKPCPFCGCQPTLRESAYYGSGEYLASINCPCINGDVAESYFLRSGETQQQATNKSIAAWNTRTESMPRALTWTTEPPKVPGWYWWRTSKGQNVNTIQVWSCSGVLGYCFDTEFITTLDRGEWAGPIPTPREPEES